MKHPQTDAMLNKIDLENQIKDLQKRNERLSSDSLKLLEGTEMLTQMLTRAVVVFRPLVHLLPETSASTEQKVAKAMHEEMEDLLKPAK